MNNNHLISKISFEILLTEEYYKIQLTVGPPVVDWLRALSLAV